MSWWTVEGHKRETKVWVCVCCNYNGANARSGVCTGQAVSGSCRGNALKWQCQKDSFVNDAAPVPLVCEHFFLLPFLVDERDAVLFSCLFLLFCFFVEWLSLHWWLIRLFFPLKLRL